MRDYESELDALVGRFRAGEAEIAAEFFAERRPLAQHLAWLRFQVAREARNLEEIADHQRCRMIEDMERAVSREEVVGQFLEDYQEIRHYAMLACLYEDLAGETINWREFREAAKASPWYELSRREHAKWADYRAHGSALDYAAALFTRGGGGAMFWGLIGLVGGDYERLLAEASKTILHDELEHGASEGRDELLTLVAGPEDMAAAARVIEEMCRLRLEMRNRQFAEVLDAARLEAIARGEIEPLSTATLMSAAPSTIDWFAAWHAAPKPLTRTSVAD